MNTRPWRFSILFLVLLSFNHHATGVRIFYIIGNMANDLPQVEKFLAEGANGVAVDVQFSLDGRPTRTSHGFPCSCFRNCFTSDIFRHVLEHFRDITTPEVSGSSDVKLSLIFLNLRVQFLGGGPLYIAGKRLGEALLMYYFEGGTSGANGWVILSVPTSRHALLFQGVKDVFQEHEATSVLDQIGFDIGSNEPMPAIYNTFVSLGINEHRWIGDGVSNCLLRNTDRLEALIDERDTGEARFSRVYHWTIDSPPNLRTSLRFGVDAIITNRPDRLLTVLEEDEFYGKYRLATPEDRPWSHVIQGGVGLPSSSIDFDIPSPSLVPTNPDILTISSPGEADLTRDNSESNKDCTKSSSLPLDDDGLSGLKLALGTDDAATAEESGSSTTTTESSSDLSATKDFEIKLPEDDASSVSKVIDLLQGRLAKEHHPYKVPRSPNDDLVDAIRKISDRRSADNTESDGELTRVLIDLLKNVNTPAPASSVSIDVLMALLASQAPPPSPSVPMELAAYLLRPPQPNPTAQLLDLLRPSYASSSIPVDTLRLLLELQSRSPQASLPLSFLQPPTNYGANSALVSLLLSSLQTKSSSALTSTLLPLLLGSKSSSTDVSKILSLLTPSNKNQNLKSQESAKNKDAPSTTTTTKQQTGRELDDSKSSSSKTPSDNKKQSVSKLKGKDANCVHNLTRNFPLPSDINPPFHRPWTPPPSTMVLADIGPDGVHWNVWEKPGKVLVPPGYSTAPFHPGDLKTSASQATKDKQNKEAGIKLLSSGFVPNVMPIQVPLTPFGRPPFPGNGPLPFRPSRLPPVGYKRPFHAGIPPRPFPRPRPRQIPRPCPYPGAVGCGPNTHSYASPNYGPVPDVIKHATSPVSDIIRYPTGTGIPESYYSYITKGLTPDSHGHRVLPPLRTVAPYKPPVYVNTRPSYSSPSHGFFTSHSAEIHGGANDHKIPFSNLKDSLKNDTNDTVDLVDSPFVTTKLKDGDQESKTTQAGTIDDIIDLLKNKVPASTEPPPAENLHEPVIPILEELHNKENLAAILDRLTSTSKPMEATTHSSKKDEESDVHSTDAAPISNLFDEEKEKQNKALLPQDEFFSSLIPKPETLQASNSGGNEATTKTDFPPLNLDDFEPTHSPLHADLAAHLAILSGKWPDEISVSGKPASTAVTEATLLTDESTSNIFDVTAATPPTPEKNVDSGRVDSSFPRRNETLLPPTGGLGWNGNGIDLKKLQELLSEHTGKRMEVIIIENTPLIFVPSSVPSVREQQVAKLHQFSGMQFPTTSAPFDDTDQHTVTTRKREATISPLDSHDNNPPSEHIPEKNHSLDTTKNPSKSVEVQDVPTDVTISRPSQGLSQLHFDQKQLVSLTLNEESEEKLPGIIGEFIPEQKNPDTKLLSEDDLEILLPEFGLKLNQSLKPTTAPMDIQMDIQPNGHPEQSVAQNKTSRPNFSFLIHDSSQEVLTEPTHIPMESTQRKPLTSTVTNVPQKQNTPSFHIDTKQSSNSNGSMTFHHENIGPNPESKQPQDELFHLTKPADDEALTEGDFPPISVMHQQQNQRPHVVENSNFFPSVDYPQQNETVTESYSVKKLHFQTVIANSQVQVKPLKFTELSEIGDSSELLRDDKEHLSQHETVANSEDFERFTFGSSVTTTVAPEKSKMPRPFEVIINSHTNSDSAKKPHMPSTFANSQTQVNPLKSIGTVNENEKEPLIDEKGHLTLKETLESSTDIDSLTFVSSVIATTAPAISKMRRPSDIILSSHSNSDSTIKDLHVYTTIANSQVKPFKSAGTVHENVKEPLIDEKEHLTLNETPESSKDFQNRVFGSSATTPTTTERSNMPWPSEVIPNPQGNANSINKSHFESLIAESAAQVKPQPFPGKFNENEHSASKLLSDERRHQFRNESPESIKDVERSVDHPPFGPTVTLTTTPDKSKALRSSGVIENFQGNLKSIYKNLHLQSTVVNSQPQFKPLTSAGKFSDNEKDVPALSTKEREHSETDEPIEGVVSTIDKLQFRPSVSSTIVHEISKIHRPVGVILNSQDNSNSAEKPHLQTMMVDSQTHVNLSTFGGLTENEQNVLDHKQRELFSEMSDTHKNIEGSVDKLKDVIGDKLTEYLSTFQDNRYSQNKPAYHPESDAPQEDMLDVSIEETRTNQNEMAVLMSTKLLENNETSFGIEFHVQQDSLLDVGFDPVQENYELKSNEHLATLHYISNAEDQPTGVQKEHFHTQIHSPLTENPVLAPSLKEAANIVLNAKNLTAFPSSDAMSHSYAVIPIDSLKTTDMLLDNELSLKDEIYSVAASTISPYNIPYSFQETQSLTNYFPETLTIRTESEVSDDITTALRNFGPSPALTPILKATLLESQLASEDRIKVSKLPMTSVNSMQNLNTTTRVKNRITQGVQYLLSDKQKMESKFDDSTSNTGHPVKNFEETLDHGVTKQTSLFEMSRSLDASVFFSKDSVVSLSSSNFEDPLVESSVAAKQNSLLTDKQMENDNDAKRLTASNQPSEDMASFYRKEQNNLYKDTTTETASTNTHELQHLDKAFEDNSKTISTNAETLITLASSVKTVHQNPVRTQSEPVIFSEVLNGDFHAQDSWEELSVFNKATSSSVTNVSPTICPCVTTVTLPAIFDSMSSDLPARSSDLSPGLKSVPAFFVSNLKLSESPFTVQPSVDSGNLIPEIQRTLEPTPKYLSTSIQNFNTGYKSHSLTANHLMQDHLTIKGKHQMYDDLVSNSKIHIDSGLHSQALPIIPMIPNSMIEFYNGTHLEHALTTSFTNTGISNNNYIPSENLSHQTQQSLISKSGNCTKGNPTKPSAGMTSAIHGNIPHSMFSYDELEITDHQHSPSSVTFMNHVETTQDPIIAIHSTVATTGLQANVPLKSFLREGVSIDPSTSLSNLEKLPSIGKNEDFSSQTMVNPKTASIFQLTKNKPPNILHSSINVKEINADVHVSHDVNAQSPSSFVPQSSVENQRPHVVTLRVPVPRPPVPILHRPSIKPAHTSGSRTVSSYAIHRNHFPLSHGVRTSQVRVLHKGSATAPPSKPRSALLPNNSSPDRHIQHSGSLSAAQHKFLQDVSRSSSLSRATPHKPLSVPVPFPDRSHTVVTIQPAYQSGVNIYRSKNGTFGSTLPLHRSKDGYVSVINMPEPQQQRGYSITVKSVHESHDSGHHVSRHQKLVSAQTLEIERMRNEARRRMATGDVQQDSTGNAPRRPRKPSERFPASDPDPQYMHRPQHATAQTRYRSSLTNVEFRDRQSLSQGQVSVNPSVHSDNSRTIPAFRSISSYGRNSNEENLDRRRERQNFRTRMENTNSEAIFRDGGDMHRPGARLVSALSVPSRRRTKPDSERQSTSWRLQSSRTGHVPRKVT